MSVRTAILQQQANPSFRELTDGNLLVASYVYHHDFVMVTPTFLMPPPALLLTSLENNCQARVNTNYYDASSLSLSECWQLKKWWLMCHKIIYFCTSVKGAKHRKGWWKFFVSCPRPKLQVYPGSCLQHQWWSGEGVDTAPGIWKSDYMTLFISLHWIQHTSSKGPTR